MNQTKKNTINPTKSPVPCQQRGKRGTLTWMMAVGRCVVRGVLTWMMDVEKFRLLPRKFGLHAILGLLLEPFLGPKNLKFQFLNI